MERIGEAIEYLTQTFSELNFPEEFSERYDILECLSHNLGEEAFLVSRKNDGKKFVARCYDHNVVETNAEPELLQRLNHPMLPKFEGSFSGESMTCYLREYIDGVSLETYIRNNNISRNQIISICISLCDVLDYLHRLSPPVIHRDIKPQNIILRADGTPVLIDFDIARTYKTDSELDTVFSGTQVYAAPEQYGFLQTDARSDIYSFGVTLRYMLTGSPRKNGNIRLYTPFEKIIDKCTSFTPKDRYKSVRQVKKDLLAANPRSRILKAAKTALCLCAVCAVLCFAGLKIYDYFTFDPFADGHIPSVLQDEERMLDAVSYLEEKYGTHLFGSIHDYATFALMKQALEEIYGMEHNYVWIGYPEDPPEESEDHFFPWPIGDDQYPDRMEICYMVTKIYWPDVVTDWSSLRDDDGEYPGSRVAEIWCKKYGILTGVNRPEDNSVGELAIALANADRVFSALQNSD